MKKILAVCILVLLLASCSNTEPNDSEKSAGGTNADTIETEQVSSAFVCELKGGAIITVGADAESIISSLGQYVDYSEAPSCVHEGSDKVYTYTGYSVMTSPGESGEFIAQVNIITDEEALANGITIGSARSDVIAAYGECSDEQFGIMKYDVGGAVITFVTENDAVLSISIGAKN